MNNKKSRIPIQKRSVEKKEQIKETALKLFSEKGYHSVSTNEIAKAAGISIGTLYSYYTDKKNIYSEIVHDVYTHILNGIIPKLPDENLTPKVLIRGYIDFVMENHSYLTTFQKEITSLSYQSEEFRLLEEPYRNFAIDKILSMLELNIDTLKIKDLNTAAYVIHLVSESVVHELSFYKSDYDKNTVLNEITNMIYNYLF